MTDRARGSPVVPLRAPARDGEPELSDEALAHAAVAGDAEALALLFDRLGEVVAAFVSRLVGSGADVEDIVQATFFTIATRKARFDGRSRARSWVLGIALNHARRQYRSRARRARLARALSVFGAGSSRAEVERRVEARDEVARVRSALDALSMSDRAALLLTELHGLGAREAALALGTTEGAIWRRVSRARAALRAMLDDGGGEGRDG